MLPLLLLTAHATTIHDLDTSFRNGHAFLADLDRDGTVEVLSAQSDGVYVFERSGSSWNQTAFTAVTGLEEAAVGDVDGDGDLDVIAATDTDVHLLRNNGGTLTASVIGTPSVEPNDIVLYDVGDDGSVDVVFASLNRELRYLDQGRNWTEDRFTNDFTAGPRDVIVSDIDGDGVGEVLLSDTQHRQIRAFGPDGVREQAVWSGGVAVEFEAADFDGDGLEELVVTGNSRNLTYLEHTPSGLSHGFLEQGTWYADLELVDYDNDGLRDILAVDGNRLRWFRGRGGGAFGSRELLATLPSSGGDLTAHDMDGDGDLDVVLNLRDGFHWFENDDACLGVGDADSDGICNDADLCAGDDSTGDSDGDGVCNADDLCDGDDVTGDSDFDGTCDSDDACLGDDDVGDSDGDGVCNDRDTCSTDDLTTPDGDGDGICDSDDLCVGDDDAGDVDGDCICGDLDTCSTDDLTTGDFDADGVCDSDDLCAGDDATGDSDFDGICGDRDICAGADVTGDPDRDGICTNRDLCFGDDPTGDADGDGICEDLDVCTGDDATGDPDRDGLCTDVDLCFGDNTAGDADGDGACDPWLRVVGALVPGGTLTLQFDNLQPGAATAYLVSARLGTPTCRMGACTELDGFFNLGTATADAQGRATKTAALPAQLPPQLYFQAVEITGGAATVSNRVEVP